MPMRPPELASPGVGQGARLGLDALRAGGLGPVPSPAAHLDALRAGGLGPVPSPAAAWAGVSPVDAQAVLRSPVLSPDLQVSAARVVSDCLRIAFGLPSDCLRIAFGMPSMGLTDSGCPRPLLSARSRLSRQSGGSWRRHGRPRRRRCADAARTTTRATLHGPRSGLPRRRRYAKAIDALMHISQPGRGRLRGGSFRGYPWQA
jgi:hypothetical protein